MLRGRETVTEENRSIKLLDVLLWSILNKLTVLFSYRDLSGNNEIFNHRIIERPALKRTTMTF